MRHLLFEFKQLALLLVRTVCGCVFYENRCIVCSSVTYSSMLCGRCRRNFESLMSPPMKKCSCCGKTLLSEISCCTNCRKERVVTSADGLFPVHSYRLSKKKLLFEWKMNGQRSLSPVFARTLWNQIRKYGLDKATLVPVPPRKGKVRKKGWDQIQEITQFLELRYGMSVCRCLERLSSVQQKKLAREQRFDNMGSSYRVKESFFADRPLPQHVVLVDDVLTTGVTVETCARLLKEKGVGKVDIVSIFIVD